MSKSFNYYKHMAEDDISFIGIIDNFGVTVHADLSTRTYTALQEGIFNEF